MWHDVAAELSTFTPEELRDLCSAAAMSTKGDIDTFRSRISEHIDHQWNLFLPVRTGNMGALLIQMN